MLAEEQALAENGPLITVTDPAVWDASTVEFWDSSSRSLGIHLTLSAPARFALWLYDVLIVYTAAMSKHLVDIDENALTAAQAELGTASMKETVNEALKRVAAGRDDKVREALDRLGRRKLPPREEAWH